MSVKPHLLPTHSEAIFNAIQAERTVARIAFNPSTVNPGDLLYVKQCQGSLKMWSW